jgi:hypothetical protein
LTMRVVCIGASRNVYRILVIKSEGKTRLGRPRHRWEDNVKMDLRLDTVVCVGLIWLRMWTCGMLL